MYPKSGFIFELHDHRKYGDNGADQQNGNEYSAVTNVPASKIRMAVAAFRMHDNQMMK